MKRIFVASVALFALIASAAVLHAQAGTIAYGQTVTSTLSAEAPQGLHNFNGTTGDVVVIYVLGHDPALMPSVALVGAAGPETVALRLVAVLADRVFARLWPQCIRPESRHGGGVPVRSRRERHGHRPGHGRLRIGSPRMAFVNRPSPRGGCRRWSAGVHPHHYRGTSGKYPRHHWCKPEDLYLALRSPRHRRQPQTPLWRTTDPGNWLSARLSGSHASFISLSGSGF